MCRLVKSLSCTPETNVTLCVNYTSIKKKKKGTWVVQSVGHLTLDLSSGLGLRMVSEFKPLVGLHTEHGAYLKRKKAAAEDTLVQSGYGDEFLCFYLGCSKKSVLPSL